MSLWKRNARREEAKTKMKEAKAERQQIRLEKERAEIKQKEAKAAIKKANGGTGMKIVFFEKERPAEIDRPKNRSTNKTRR